jgi:polyisoprenoid-binding protein YceI
MAWQIDFSHSHIYFTARHMMISKVRGGFENFSGTIKFDEENPTSTMIDVDVDLNSINTRDEKRDGHLKSPDFFDVATYPTMKFVSTRVEQIDDNNGRLYGQLTIKNISKEIVLDVEYAGVAKSPWGVESAGFSASGNIDRKEWGLTWNQALETGGVLVGDKINIEIELELMKQAQAETA